MLLKGELHQPHDYITNIIKPYTTDGVTVTSLSSNLQHKTQAAMDHICQITLNQKLSHKFEKWRKFSSHIKAKSHKRELSKMRPACSFFF